MEKKNTVLLTVIAVATLLVAVVGATFAYFTATSSTVGNSGDANLQTASSSANGAYAVVSADTTTGDISYPGGFIAAGIKVNGKKAGGSSDEHNYTLTYNLTGTFNLNGIDNSNIKYALYEVSASKKSALEGKTCTKKDVVGTNADPSNWPENETRSWYEDCETDKIDALLSGAAKVQDWTSLPASGSLTFSNETLNVTEPDTNETYYYLVLAYENDTANNQNNDMNKSLVVSLSVAEGVTSAYAS